MAIHVALADQSLWQGILLCSAAVDVEWTPMLRCSKHCSPIPYALFRPADLVSCWLPHCSCISKKQALSRLWQGILLCSAAVDVEWTPLLRYRECCTCIQYILFLAQQILFRARFHTAAAISRDCGHPSRLVQSIRLCSAAADVE